MLIRNYIFTNCFPASWHNHALEATKGNNAQQHLAHVGMVVLSAIQTLAYLLVMIFALPAYCTTRYHNIKNQFNISTKTTKEAIQTLCASLFQAKRPPLSTRRQALTSIIQLLVKDLCFWTVGTPLITYLHELGHAAAIQLLYKNPTIIKIQLYQLGFGGGVTRYRISDVSRLGSYFGEKGVDALVSAAGPTVELALCTLAYYFDHDSLFFLSASLSEYASNYLFSKRLSIGHDFWYIAQSVGSKYANLAAAIALLLPPYLILKRMSKHRPVASNVAKDAHQRKAWKEKRLVWLAQSMMIVMYRLRACYLAGHRAAKM